MDDHRQRNIIIGVGVVILAAATALVIAVLSGDDDQGTATTTSSTSSSTTASSSSTTTSVAEAPTTTVPRGDLDLAVFPDLTGGSRFSEPQSLVKAFATERLGFDTDVVVGPLRQGDARSGEVDVHPPGSTAITTVLVRQISDQSWVVVAAQTDSIRLDTPMAGTRISSPQPLIGAASAFEGHVDVMLYVDGEEVPVATTFVTGRGDGELGDFRGELTFTAPEGATHGVIVLSEPSADDNFTNAAIAIRVRL